METKSSKELAKEFIDKLSKEDIELLNTPMLKTIKQELKPKFASSITSDGEKLIIDSFTNGAIGKFINLYGLEDLFKSLPSTLKEFQIQNKDVNNNTIIKTRSIGLSTTY